MPRSLRRDSRADRSDANAPTRSRRLPDTARAQTPGDGARAGNGAQLLLLDEIAGGLTEGECAELVDTIRDIHASGVTIIWIEQSCTRCSPWSSRLIVLNFGRKIAEGDPPGGDAASRRARDLYRHRGLSHPLLETRNLTAFYGDFQALFGIDTNFDAGETVAIIGANGAGKSTFLKAIAGLIPAPPTACGSTASRSARSARPILSSSASRWCRRAGGCFPR